MLNISKPPVLRQVVLGLTLAAASVLTLAAPTGQGGQGGQGGQDGPGHPAPAGAMGAGLPQGRMLDRLLEDVKASPEQREQIRKITQANQPDRQAEREAARATQDQLMQAFVNADPKTADAARQQLMARHDAASRRHVQTLLDVAKVLTPEQRKQLAERMKRQAEPGAGREGREGRGPDGGGEAGGPGAGSQDKPRR